MSVITKEAIKEANNAQENNKSNTDVSDDTCVVCFKNVDIYSIGECDHPVCYECSTRMRVLCQQNECPICRQVLAKVIFTNTKLPYRELETKHRSDYYSKKYKIGFNTMKIQQAFFALLDHPCPKCNAPPYRTFIGLKNHVRKEHDLHYCDLCIENLKIFTFERRCYTQAELGLHRTKGDADNRSHRGHPLCEYCNKRYLDRDELFRHLRIDHYFCHFCDADGCNEFYRDYDALAQHFREDHYLCEEGKCATEQFVGAFRTEIDYKAHIAKEHAQLLNKQQAKQTRTLQLEITLGPRGRSGPGESGVSKMRGRGGGEPPYPAQDEPSTSQSTHLAAQQHSITIDACNEQDFPSLGGGAAGPSVSLIRPPPQSMMNRSGTSGLARTKENFPALGGGGGGGAGQRPSSQPISSIVRKAPAASTGAIARNNHHNNNNNNNGNGMVLHVSNRPPSSANSSTKKPMTGDFPALPLGKTKKQSRLEEDMITCNSNIPMTNVSAKHRTLVDDYVSVANPTNFQKIQMVLKEDMAQKKAAQKKNAPQLTTEEFPSLGRSGSSAPLPNHKPQTSAQWIKSLSEKKQRELENRKSKVAPMPVLTKDNRAVPKKANETETTPKKEQKKPKDKEKDKKNGINTAASSSNNGNGNGKGKEKQNNNNNRNTNNENKASSSNTNLNGFASPPGKKHAPPPGFLTDQSNVVNAPPGFQPTNVTVNSVAKSPNNLTFTSSLGESYSILPAHSYVNPPEATVRNQTLVNLFKGTLLSPEAFEEFRCISLMFREGTCKTEAYYDHCRSALGKTFDDVFPELIALLPDIAKQQDLYLVHAQRMQSLSPHQRKLLPKLEVCSTCKQVLLAGDLEAHQKLHSMNKNFPALNGRGQ